VSYTRGIVILLLMLLISGISAF